VQTAIAKHEEPDNGVVSAAPNAVAQRSNVPTLLNQLATPVTRVIRLPWKWLLLVVVWVIPTILTGIFLFSIASDQYVSEFRFNLRSASSPQISLPGGLQGGGGMSGMSPTIVWDSHVITQFIKSQDVVAEIDKRFGFKTIYRPDSADFFFRMGDHDSLEEMTQYWRSIADPFFDMQTGVISVKIRAFSPEDAYRVAQLVLELAEKVVNEMSDRSHQDALAFARTEVTMAEEKLREAQLAVRGFRNSRELINPAREAELSIMLVARQREELSKLKSELDSLRSYLDETAPPVRVLKSKIAAVEHAVREDQQKIVSRNNGTVSGTAPGNSTGSKPGTGSTETLSFALTDYETLMFEQTFRERAYALAQEALQKARVEADKQNLYLNAFVKPRTPQMSIFPQRGKLFAIVTFSLLVIWGLMCLVIFSVRDHI
jgi:capsular polysaccharide transport system permease protein